MLSSGNEHGFSLIEVLLGVAIFMIGMLGIAALQISSIRGDAFSANLTEATYLLNNKIEDLMGRGYDHADLTDDNADGSAGLTEQIAPDGIAPNLGRNQIYEVYWNVATNLPMLDCKTIQVYARWYVKGVAQPPITMQFVKEKFK